MARKLTGCILNIPIDHAPYSHALDTQVEISRLLLEIATNKILLTHSEAVNFQCDMEEMLHGRLSPVATAGLLTMGQLRPDMQQPCAPSLFELPGQPSVLLLLLLLLMIQPSLLTDSDVAHFECNMEGDEVLAELKQ
ncbi:uncharacterized protein LOC126234868 [Schistocerca nitens]|uniref:uncharacterized protein LOC126234868 n=1 Tax=Schistocerca nitens TaxID=7011 RepID=UPI0021190356|nr:uncharacterized protein LOC126234868 [Schistocerca nitens]